MKIVIDNNVLISGILWGGKPMRVLERIDSGIDQAFTSREILIELDRVLAYPKFVRPLKNAGVPRQDIVHWIVERATIVIPKPLTRTIVIDDPSDDRILACAASSGADFVITGDTRHLIPLGKWDGIKIVTASNYLKLVATT